jgi:hypothetical protein
LTARPPAAGAARFAASASVGGRAVGACWPFRPRRQPRARPQPDRTARRGRVRPRPSLLLPSRQAQRNPTVRTKRRRAPSGASASALGSGLH